MNNFKELYLRNLKGKLNNYLPSGYKLRLIDDITYSDFGDDEHTIIVAVRFGAAVKAIDDIRTYIQPITLSIYSEGFGMDVTYKVFETFFKTESHQILDKAMLPYCGMITYTSPTVVKPFTDVMGRGISRTNLIMTGQAVYSTDTVTGGKYYLNGEEIQPIEMVMSYQTQSETVAYQGEYALKSIFQSGITTISLAFYAKENTIFEIAQDILYYNSPGNLLITYSEVINAIENIHECFVSSIEKQYQPNSGMYLIRLTLTPKEVI